MLEHSYEQFNYYQFKSMIKYCVLEGGGGERWQLVPYKKLKINRVCNSLLLISAAVAAAAGIISYGSGPEVTASLKLFYSIKKKKSNYLRFIVGCC